MASINSNQFINELHDFIDSGGLDELIYEVIDEYGEVYLEDAQPRAYNLEFSSKGVSYRNKCSDVPLEGELNVCEFSQTACAA